MGISRITTVIIALAFASVAAPSWAFLAPNSVQADESGNFSYDATIWAAPQNPVSHFVVRDLENTDVGVVFYDCFCPPEYEGCVGDVLIPVTGSLQDPSEKGKVSVEASFCSGSSYEQTTTIRRVVPNNLPTMSRLGTILLPLLLLATGAVVFARLRPMRC